MTLSPIDFEKFIIQFHIRCMSDPFPSDIEKIKWLESGLPLKKNVIFCPTKATGQNITL